MQSRRVWLPDARRPGARRRACCAGASSPSRAAGRSAPDDAHRGHRPGGWVVAGRAGAGRRPGVARRHVLRVETAAVVAATLMVAAAGGRGRDEPATAVRRVRAHPVLRRRAATTARSPRGPTGRTSSATTSTPCAPRSSGPSTPGCRRPTSVFVGGGTPTLVPADGPGRGAAGDPARRRRRGHRRVQPRRRHRGDVRDVRRAPASTGCRSACSRWCPHVLAALGRTHDPANVERAVAAVRAVGLPTFNLDIIYGAVGGVARPTGARRSSARSTSSRRTCRRTPSPSRPARRSPTIPARHPDDDVQADEYELADELLTAAGLANYEVSNWARPGHECRHNLLYWAPARLPAASAAPPTPTAPGGGGGTCARRSATSTRSPPAARPRRPARRSTPTTRRVEGLQLSLRTTAGVPARRPRRRRPRPASSSAPATAGCSPGAAA